jgi:hypothetical protein
MFLAPDIDLLRQSNELNQILHYRTFSVSNCRISSFTSKIKKHGTMVLNL